MKTYYGLQVKRLARLLPYVAVVAVLLLAGAAAVFSAFVQYDAESEANQILRVGIAGDTDNPHFEFGMSALQTLDSSRYTIEMVTMEEAAARRALENGDISAYVVVPDGFTEAALHGEIRPIQCVVSSGTSGLVSLFKEEIANVVRDMLVESQKGIYGLSHSLTEADLPGADHIDRLSLRFVTLILHRDKLYEVEEIGGADGLPLIPSMACGIAVVLLWLVGLPYAAVLIRRDMALARVLAARGYTPLTQIAAEYAAYVTVLVPPVYAVASVLLLVADTGLTAGEAVRLLLCAFPLLLLAAAFLLLVFSCVRDVISGMLTAFFAVVALGYIAGCLYPLYAFPTSVQAVAAVLPTGLSRMYLADMLTGEGLSSALWGIVLYTVLFFAAAVLVRRYRITDRGAGQ